MFSRIISCKTVESVVNSALAKFVKNAGEERAAVGPLRKVSFTYNVRQF